MSILKGKPLTKREAQILRYVERLFTNLEISETLGVARDTVTWNLTNIYKKLGVTGRVELLSRSGSHETGQAEGHISPELQGG